MWEEPVPFGFLSIAVWLLIKTPRIIGFRLRQGVIQVHAQTEQQASHRQPFSPGVAAAAATHRLECKANGRALRSAAPVSLELVAGQDLTRTTTIEGVVRNFWLGIRGPLCVRGQGRNI